jgi:outer membrane protein assembly factor BamE (lipoprotein component of BamABCDE complex)
MKLTVRIATIGLACLMVLVTVDTYRARSAARRARALKVGDTKEQVRHALGRPSGITIPGNFDDSETWAYGGYVDWRNLLSCPVRSRLFGPDPDEVAVQFNSSGRVSRIILPQRQK